MSLEQQQFDLLAAFRSRFGLGDVGQDDDAPPSTRVLSGAEHVARQAIDVFIDRVGTQDAAQAIVSRLRAAPLSPAAWSEFPLHPRPAEMGEEQAVAFVFTMGLLNFSFWSDDGYAVKYNGKEYSGYWSMVAALRRAIDDGVPVTSSDWWQSEEECDVAALEHIFRSESGARMPLLDERLAVLREVGTRIYERFDCSFMAIVRRADKSAARLVNLLHDNFPSFRDTVRWEDERVRFLKRAQILVADLWACFEGKGPGEFHDIDCLSAFPDYRIPQMLYSLGVISYSPPLDNRIRQKGLIEPGHDWEIQLRGCSVWAVELLKREVKRQAAEDPDVDPAAIETLNSVLLDYYLYDTAKELEATGEEVIPHHRTRSIWY